MEQRRPARRAGGEVVEVMAEVRGAVMASSKRALVTGGDPAATYLGPLLPDLLVPSAGVLARPGVVVECGLNLPAELPFDEWARLGDTLGRIRRATLWWVGDWLNYGERVYGESYAQAIETTGLDYGTLRNAAWVASRFPLSRRRDTLSFAHHQAVAALLPENQAKWLARAAPEPGEEKPRLTVKALRDAVLGPPVEAQAKDEPWYVAPFRSIYHLAMQGIDRSLPPGAAADAICAEAMKIQARAKEAEHA